MILYTVANNDGENREINLTLADAARRLLHDDGRDYEIRPRPDGDGFDLWSRQEVANIKWQKTTIFSLETDPAAAENDIFQRVVNAADNVMTHHQYAEMMQRLIDDADDDDERAAYQSELDALNAK